MCAQRTEDYASGSYRRDGGVVNPLPVDAPEFVKRYFDYYKTPRGFHPRSGNSTDGWNTTSFLPFINFTLLDRIGEIRNAAMLVHGEKAHSLYFSEDAFKRLQGDNKELLIVADADHTDLYDNLDKIPFDQIATFRHEKNIYNYSLCIGDSHVIEREDTDCVLQLYEQCASDYDRAARKDRRGCRTS